MKQTECEFSSFSGIVSSVEGSKSSALSHCIVTLVNMMKTWLQKDEANVGKHRIQIVLLWLLWHRDFHEN